MTFWSSVVFQMPQQLVLSTAGRLKLVAPILTATLRTPAVSVWIMVGLTHFVSRLALWVLQKGWYCGCVSMTEKYAQHWCSMLSDPQGVFAPCHSEISPDSYKEVSPLLQLLHSSVDLVPWQVSRSHTIHTLHYTTLYFVSTQNCIYDSCNCEKSEDCMCAAVSSYVHACAAVGIQLSGWRTTICGK